MLLLILATAALLSWLVLWLGWADFWRIDREPVPPPPADWPDIQVIIPARNEAPVIAETLRSLYRQDYPGRVRIVVVDDHSEDGTAEVAWQAASAEGRSADLTVIRADPLPPGWTGKVWAMQQGLRRGGERKAPYILFSDADIAHGPGALRELVSRAEATGADLVSFMVRLRCETVAEKLMIPAFVFFFKLLYPFRRVNERTDRTAGAAGGTMLVRRQALERIGGLEGIRHALIDDCSLAHAIQQGGHRIWLGMTAASCSSRGYGSLGEVVRMIARTAYTQLGYSPWMLLGCLLGLSLTFLAPPLLVGLRSGIPSLLGALAWLVMLGLYLPMVRFYRLSPLWALPLPLTALLYGWATVVSAWHHHHGRGGQWKGRSQAPNVTPLRP